MTAVPLRALLVLAWGRILASSLSLLSPPLLLEPLLFLGLHLELALILEEEPLFHEDLLVCISERCKMSIVLRKLLEPPCVEVEGGSPLFTVAFELAVKLGRSHRLRTQHDWVDHRPAHDCPGDVPSRGSLRVNLPARV